MIKAKRRQIGGLWNESSFIAVKNPADTWGKSWKDKTKLNCNLDELADENTLKGIFIKEIKEELDKTNYTKEELDKILEIGISILEN